VATDPPSLQHDLAPLETRRWWSAARVAAAIWVVLVNAGLWWFYHRPAPKVLWGDENIYLRSASRLLSGDPGWWPEPLWPPLYPQFIAGLTWLGGGSLVAVQVAQGLLLAVTAVLLFDLTRRLTGSRAAGFTAAILSVGFPTLVAFSHYLWPEVFHLFLFVALLWLLIVRWPRPVWLLVAGVVLGLALLTKSLLLFFVPVMLVAAAWGTRPRQAVGRLAIVFLSTALTVAPMVSAQARRTGSYSVGGSSIFNLWVGLNDVGRESFEHDVVWPEYQRWVESAPLAADRNRILRTKTVALVKERGLVRVIRGQLSKQYFRLFDVGSYLTDQLPGGPARRLAGAGYPEAGPGWSRLVRAGSVICYLLLLVAAPLGLIVGSCRGDRWVRTLLIFLAYNLALLLFLHVKTRYRIQMLPVAFVGVGCLVAWVEAGCRPRPSAARIGTAVAVIALLLCFALG
jgi:4-amino-4-deoxy-L-arabinose transferase-like glycosyltransferase